MHELGVVFYIIEDLEKIALENKVSKINSVTLELGEVSSVIPEYLTKCWRWAVDRTTLLKDSFLKIEKITAITHCDSCQRNFETVKHGKICPHCKSSETWLLKGSEFNIKEIEAESESETEAEG